MLCLLFHDALPFLSPKHLLPQNRDRKKEIEKESLECQTIIHRQASRSSTSGRGSYEQKPSPSPKSKPKNPKLRCRRCHRGSYEQSNAASEAGFGIFFLWVLLNIAKWLKYLFWVCLYFLFLFSFVECKLCLW